MPRIHITDIDDKRILHYRNLPQANLTSRSGRFIVEGWLLVERLLASRFDVDSVLIDESRLNVFDDKLSPNVVVYITPHSLVDQVVGFNFHRGILACGLRRPPESLDSALSTAARKLTLVVCAQIHDPTNLGAILRSCAAFGVDAVLLSPQCADPFSRRVIRVSMGAALRLTIVPCRDLMTDLERLRVEYHVQLAATVLDSKAEILSHAQRPERFALIFGNEGHGLPADVISKCDRRITIPMKHETDSLNAAVATGVFLYHFTA